ncbi:response regulator [Thermogemmatispora sp.]|uniref:response regulator n=1 Tax=Thermogemmatispora sp. TaxID=1968838 RepID=UPI0035E44D6D
MSEQSRILVVTDDAEDGQAMLTALRADGYLVQGASGTAEALRLLWREMHHLVIAELKLASADDFELVRWLRLYYPRTAVLLLTPPEAGEERTQALERGVAALLDKPLNLERLRAEVRRLLAQPGFSASLDSFDLLDVIQIVTMSRKKIALVVSTDQGERGLLRFQNGELIWAEYGVLRGEEAFFALAAHRTGTVSYQPWEGEITPNVAQPLSRLILQALQYRAKYSGGEAGSGVLPAPGQQATGEQQGRIALSLEEIDDTPFGLLDESGSVPATPSLSAEEKRVGVTQEGTGEHGGREWWMATGYVPRLGGNEQRRDGGAARSGDSAALPVTGHVAAASAAPGGAGAGTTGKIPTPNRLQRLPPSEAIELPSWLTEQPTQAELPPVIPVGHSPLTTGQLPVLPTQRQGGDGRPASAVFGQQAPVAPEQPLHLPLSTDTGIRLRRIGGNEGQPSTALSSSSASGTPSSGGPLQSLRSLGRGSGPLSLSPSSSSPAARQESPALPDTGALTGPRPALGPSASLAGTTGALPGAGTGPLSGARSGPLPRVSRRNISAIVAALQTLGYAIPGFVATAVLSMEGLPIAQVSVDDLDLSPMGGHLKAAIQGIVRSLELGNWGPYEDLVVTSSNHRLLLRLIEGGSTAFHVLVTTREADLKESMEVMANVEGAIAAAL